MNAQQVLRGDLERLGGALPLAGVLPQDRGAALGRDHRVHRVLQHQHPVGHAERQRAARAALADHHRDARRRQRRHLQDVAGQRLGLAPLLRAQAGIGARRVDQGDDRALELGGQLHQPERLPVALRVGHAEVALEVFLGVAALLVADHHDRHAGQPGPAADDRGVVHVEPVAVQLDEVGEDGAEIVEGVRPAGVAGHHDPLERRQVSVDVRPERLQLALQPFELPINIDLPLRPDTLEVVDLTLQLEERLLEVQGVG